MRQDETKERSNQEESSRIGRRGRVTLKKRLAKRLHRELQKTSETLAEESRKGRNWEKQKSELLQVLYEGMEKKADALSDAVLLGMLEQSTGILEQNGFRQGTAKDRG